MKCASALSGEMFTSNFVDFIFFFFCSRRIQLYGTAMELTLMNSRIIPGETSLIGCVSLLVCRFVYDVVGNGNLRPVMDALRADCIRFRKWTELNLFVVFFPF